VTLLGFLFSLRPDRPLLLHDFDLYDSAFLPAGLASLER